MKAPAFDYFRATALAEVFALLQQHGDAARVLAGGQTLLATLNMRLSEPALLIDIGALNDLRGIHVAGNNLCIGALTTHAEIAACPLVAQHAPLLAMAAPHIAHLAIRNRGTLGGSLAYADPAAEWPACVLALSATLVLTSARGERRVAADDFFTGLYTKVLAADELLARIELPVLANTEQQAFEELARRQGDYAIVGIAARALRQDGCLRDVRLAFLGLGDKPLRAPQAERAMQGQRVNELTLAAASAALQSDIDPSADLTNDVSTKRHLAAVLMQRVLRRLVTP